MPPLPQAAPELAPGGSTAAGLDLEALQQRLQAAQPPAASAKSIVVVGWSGATTDLLVRPAAIRGLYAGSGGVGRALHRLHVCTWQRSCSPSRRPACPHHGTSTHPSIQRPVQTGLTEFAAPGSEIIFVGPHRPPDFPAEAQQEVGGGGPGGQSGCDACYEVQGRTCRFIQVRAAPLGLAGWLVAGSACVGGGPPTSAGAW